MPNKCKQFNARQVKKENKKKFAKVKKKITHIYINSINLILSIRMPQEAGSYTNLMFQLGISKTQCKEHNKKKQTNTNRDPEKLSVSTRERETHSHIHTETQREREEKRKGMRAKNKYA